MSELRCVRSLESALKTTQPLFMPGLTTAGPVHHALLVATEHDSIHARDALRTAMCS
jgi:hypothetical protein